MENHTKRIALTFDDGPNGNASRGIVDILRAQKVPATFFVVGRSVVTDPETVKYCADRGFTIGNHSDDHSFFLPLRSRRRIMEGLFATSQSIERITGIHPTWFRPPHGFCSPNVFAAAKQSKLNVVGWSIDPRDYATGDVALIAQRVIEQAHDGGIILLHDGLHDGPKARKLRDRRGTIAALPLIISGLRERGFDFISLDELKERQPNAAAWCSHLWPQWGCR